MNDESWIQFVVDRLPELWLRLGQHLVLTGASTLMAILIGIPCGIIAMRSATVRNGIIGTVSILQTIPSLAMLTLLLAVMHRIGVLPAIVALTLYALLPIVRNTIAGLEGVSSDVIEAAVGIGMTPGQQLWMVKLPLAMPIIIAGIRTAAVTCVGVATLAAFIGAGGLGQFIIRGLALMNTPLILLGAIPAAVLAIVVDGAIAVAGWAVSPKQSSTSDASRKLMQTAGLLLPLLLFGSGAMAYVRTNPDVVIGSKKFSESLILGHMMADLIESQAGLRVDRRFCLGGTMICHNALINGEIDLYAEYTGTALTAVLKKETVNNPQAVYQQVSEQYVEMFDLVWLEPFGINNPYALAVTEEMAAKHDWEKISDLEPMADQLTAGWTAEFAERPDGYLGLIEAYGFQFDEVIDLEASLMYSAVVEGEVDVVAAYSTDGRIAAYDLVLLEDDRNFFPPYYAAPIIRQETLNEYPEVRAALRHLAGALDIESMQLLNLQVDEYKKNPEDVAREWLVEQGLLNR